VRPSTTFVRVLFCAAGVHSLLWTAALPPVAFAQSPSRAATAGPPRKPATGAPQSAVPNAARGGTVGPGTAQRAVYQDAGPAQNPAELPAPQIVEGGPPGSMQPYYEASPSDQPWLNEGAPMGYGYGGGPMGYGVLGGLWVRGEYLAWDMKGMYLPPLVISSNVANINPVDLHLNDNGDLGATDPVTILYGGQAVNSDVRNGWKISAGVWLDNCQTVGIEGDYFMLEDGNDSFFVNSTTGNPILARPFYNVLTGLESSVLVAYPTAANGVVHRGSIAVDTSTAFNGAGARGIINLGCNNGCGTNWWNGCPQPTMGRVDLIVGYRYLRLDDSINIVENSTLNPGGAFNIRDQFDADNTFNGFDIGTQLKHQRGCWSFELLSKIALGNTRSRVNIDGSTTITPAGGAAQQFVGGILAQRTNIGEYQQDEFAVVPELGLTVGYQLNPCWKLTAGYTWLYWSRVARAGDQIDRNLNPDLFPEEANPQADDHLQPRFHFVHDDFWAHGLRVGLEGTW
jgi:hypothetical protein